MAQSSMQGFPSGPSYPGQSPRAFGAGARSAAKTNEANLYTIGWNQRNSTFCFGNETQMATAATAVRAIPRMIYRGGYFYIWGGLTTGAVNTFNKYDPATDAYSSVTQNSPPAGRYLHEACIYNDEMYIFAGYTTTPVNTMYKYNFGTETWSQITYASGTPPTARYLMNGVVVGNIWYLHGGTNGTTAYNEFFSFNLDTLTWSALTASGFTAAGSAVVFLTNGIYIIGGENYNTSAFYDTVKYYDLATAAWSTLPVLPAARYRASSLACDGGIHVWGGSLAGGAGQTTHYFYNPSLNSWQTLKALPSGYLEGAAGYCNNAMWAFGGLEANGSTRSNKMRKYT